MIENILPAPKREPEIELQVGLDPEGNLEATASDPLSGEKQSLVGEPAFARRRGKPRRWRSWTWKGKPKPARRSRRRPSADRLSGESYPVGAVDRRKEPLERRPRRARWP